MVKRALAFAVVVGLVTIAGACTSAPPPTASVHPAPTPEKPVITGPLTRAQLTDIPHWTLPDTAVVDEASAQALARVPPGAHVLAVIGTWCSDSKREMPRLYKTFDLAGISDAAPATLPFTFEVIGVDRDKKSPGLTLDVAYVPTFIVTRPDSNATGGSGGGAREVGRIVESAPNGIEKDLLSLLDGTRSGVITGRQEPAQ